MLSTNEPKVNLKNSFSVEECFFPVLQVVEVIGEMFVSLFKGLQEQ